MKPLLLSGILSAASVLAPSLQAATQAEPSVADRDGNIILSSGEGVRFTCYCHGGDADIFVRAGTEEFYTYCGYGKVGTLVVPGRLFPEGSATLISTSCRYVNAQGVEWTGDRISTALVRLVPSVVPRESFLLPPVGPKVR